MLSAHHIQLVGVALRFKEGIYVLSMCLSQLVCATLLSRVQMVLSWACHLKDYSRWLLSMAARALALKLSPRITAKCLKWGLGARGQHEMKSCIRRMALGMGVVKVCE